MPMSSSVVGRTWSRIDSKSCGSCARRVYIRASPAECTDRSSRRPGGPPASAGVGRQPAQPRIVREVVGGQADDPGAGRARCAPSSSVRRPSRASLSAAGASPAAGRGTARRAAGGRRRRPARTPARDSTRRGPPRADPRHRSPAAAEEAAPRPRRRVTDGRGFGLGRAMAMPVAGPAGVERGGCRRPPRPAATLRAACGDAADRARPVAGAPRQRFARRSRRPACAFAAPIGRRLRVALAPAGRRRRASSAEPAVSSSSRGGGPSARPGRAPLRRARRRRRAGPRFLDVGQDVERSAASVRRPQAGERVGPAAQGGLVARARGRARRRTRRAPRRVARLAADAWPMLDVRQRAVAARGRPPRGRRRAPRRARPRERPRGRGGARPCSARTGVGHVGSPSAGRAPRRGGPSGRGAGSPTGRR